MQRTVSAVLRTSSGVVTEDTRCARCPKKATVFCPDCNAQLCDACSGHLHHPGMFTEMHSVEQIIQDEERLKGVRLISPLADEICFLLLFWFIVRHVELSEDYLSRPDICPVGNIARKAVAWIDTFVFYHYKDEFLRLCGVEDSFWKFILDAWVRTIVTNSDSALLLLKTLPQAFLFGVVIATFVLPIFSTAYAIIVLFIFSVEKQITRTDLLIRMEHYVGFLNFIQLSHYAVRPPRTRPRIRPSRDIFESWQYWKSRHVRWFRYYYTSADNVILYFTSHAVCLIACLRVVCILTDVGPILRSLCSYIGLADIIAKHQMYFGRASHMLDTDPVLWQSVSTFVSIFKKFVFGIKAQGLVLLLVLGFAMVLIEFSVRLGIIGRGWLTSSRVQRLVLAPLAIIVMVVPFARTLFAAAAFFVIGVVLLCRYLLTREIARQNMLFDNLWEEKYRRLTVGDCPCLYPDGVCPCLSTQPREVILHEHSQLQGRRVSMMNWFGDASSFFE